MIEDTKAVILIITAVALLAFVLGCVFGSFHVAEEYSEQLIPTSLTSSDDMIKPVKETNTTMSFISIKQPAKPKVIQNKTRNVTNKTNTTNETNSTNDTDKTDKQNTEKKVTTSNNPNSKKPNEQNSGTSENQN